MKNQAIVDNLVATITIIENDLKRIPTPEEKMTFIINCLEWFNLSLDVILTLKQELKTQTKRNDL